MGEEFWKTALTNATPTGILALVAWFGAPFIRKTLESQQTVILAQHVAENALHEQEKAFLKGQLSECRQECRQEMAALRQEHREERQADRAVIVRMNASVEAMHEDIAALRNERTAR